MVWSFVLKTGDARVTRKAQGSRQRVSEGQSSGSASDRLGGGGIGGHFPLCRRTGPRIRYGNPRRIFTEDAPRAWNDTGGGGLPDQNQPQDAQGPRSQ